MDNNKKKLYCPICGNERKEFLSYCDWCQKERKRKLMEEGLNNGC